LRQKILLFAAPVHKLNFIHTGILWAFTFSNKEEKAKSKNGQTLNVKFNLLESSRRLLFQVWAKTEDNDNWHLHAHQTRRPRETYKSILSLSLSFSLSIASSQSAR